MRKNVYRCREVPRVRRRIGYPRCKDCEREYKRKRRQGKQETSSCVIL
jgi:hypothetical protein